MKKSHMNTASIFGYLQSIRLFWDIGENGNYEHFAEMLLSEDQYNQHNNQRIRFFNVRKYVMGEIIGLFFTQISITNVAAHQMEDINYSVAEEEHSLFSFYCKSFTVEELH